MNKLFVTGDVHGSGITDRLSSENFPDGQELDRGDILFFAGDFGYVWDKVAKENEIAILDWLNSQPYTSLVIGGNHENWDRLRALPMTNKFGVELGVLRDNVLFVPNGTMFTFGDKRVWCMGGAMSTDRGGLNPNVWYPGEGTRWWRGEIPSISEMNRGTDLIEAANWEVDTIITHTMPAECVGAFVNKYRYHLERVQDPTSRYLSLVLAHTKFKNWYCGHFHKNDTFGRVRCIYGEILDVNSGERVSNDQDDFWTKAFDMYAID